MDSLENSILIRVTLLVPLLLSLAVHEWAHAWCALRLGDDTAQRLGRVTLNPLAHLDLVGTLLLPLLGVPFGWAKPVPVNPVRFRADIPMGRGLLLTAAAGPISNLCLAGACTALLAVVSRWPPLWPAGNEPLATFLHTMVLLNVLLAAFNLLPVPPLDGGRIVDAFVPHAWRPAWDRFTRLGPVVLACVLLLPLLAGYSVLSGPLDWVERWLKAIQG